MPFPVEERAATDLCINIDGLNSLASYSICKYETQVAPSFFTYKKSYNGCMRFH